MLKQPSRKRIEGSIALKEPDEVYRDNIAASSAPFYVEFNQSGAGNVFL